MPMTTRSMSRGEFYELKLLNNTIASKVKKYYEEYHWPEDINDFTEIRSEDEYLLIKKCCELIPKTGTKKTSLFAVLWYYYSIVVLEYYVKIGFRELVSRKHFRECYRKYMLLCCSDEQWASEIRRLILKF